MASGCVVAPPPKGPGGSLIITSTLPEIIISLLWFFNVSMYKTSLEIFPHNLLALKTVFKLNIISITWQQTHRSSHRPYACRVYIFPYFHLYSCWLRTNFSWHMCFAKLVFIPIVEHCYRFLLFINVFMKPLLSTTIQCFPSRINKHHSMNPQTTWK